MAIAFNCPCGTKLSAKDELAGRRMRCPACGYEQTIPAPGAKPAPVLAHKPVQPPHTSVPRQVVAGPMFQVSAVPPAVVPMVAPSGNAVPPASVPARPALVADVPLQPVREEAAETVPASQLEQTLVVPIARPAPNPWVDRSLEQRITPWPDEETRRRGSDPYQPHGTLIAVVCLAAVLLLAGGGIAALQFWKP